MATDPSGASGAIITPVVVATPRKTDEPHAVGVGFPPMGHEELSSSTGDVESLKSSGTQTAAGPREGRDLFSSTPTSSAASVPASSSGPAQPIRLKLNFGIGKHSSLLSSIGVFDEKPDPVLDAPKLETVSEPKTETAEPHQAKATTSPDAAKEDETSPTLTLAPESAPQAAQSTIPPMFSKLQKPSLLSATGVFDGIAGSPEEQKEVEKVELQAKLEDRTVGAPVEVTEPIKSEAPKADPPEPTVEASTPAAEAAKLFPSVPPPPSTADLLKFRTANRLLNRLGIKPNESKTETLKEVLDAYEPEPVKARRALRPEPNERVETKQQSETEPVPQAEASQLETRPQESPVKPQTRITAPVSRMLAPAPRNRVAEIRKDEIRKDVAGKEVHDAVKEMAAESERRMAAEAAARIAAEAAKARQAEVEAMRKDLGLDKVSAAGEEVVEQRKRGGFTKTAPPKIKASSDFGKGKDRRHGRRNEEGDEDEEEEVARAARRKFVKGRGREDDEIDGFSHKSRKFVEEVSMYGGLQPVRKKEKAKRDILLPTSISVSGLADLLTVPLGKLQRKMRDMGMEEKETYQDYRGFCGGRGSVVTWCGLTFALPFLTGLGHDTASLIVMEFNHNPVLSTETITPSVTPEAAQRLSQVTDLKPRPEPTSWAKYPERPPVVTIMGHVDHGKTTLLDTLRRTSVAASEFGGITQHIGAFTFVPPGSTRRVTFLDTPGHAAFTTMRARGAQATDIVVLVVAADDGVMPQTVESIRLAQEAGATIVVAVNKCDKPGVDPLRVQEKLLEHGIQTEEFGGDIPAVHVSALKNTGLDTLVESILTIAEIQLDVRGDPTGPVEGVVLESRMDKGRGIVATVLVKRGTLEQGKVLVAGDTYCKVRKMDDENGNVVDEAGPATPVEIIGWKEQPSAGELVIEAPDESTARRVVETRLLRSELEEEVKSVDIFNEQRAKHREQRSAGLSTDQALAEQTKEDREAELKRNQTVTMIVKADVDGSLEAILQSLQKLPQDEVIIYVVDSGVGAVTESDLMKAEVAGGALIFSSWLCWCSKLTRCPLLALPAMIMTFNVPLEKKLADEAHNMKIEVREHNIIYKFLDDVKDMMSDRLPVTKKIDVVAEANVQAIFEISTKKGGKEKVAGCKMETGKLTRKSKIRVMRHGQQIYEGELRSMKHFKKEVEELVKGQECGLMLDDFEDMEPGDVIQAITVTEIKRRIS